MSIYVFEFKVFFLLKWLPLHTYGSTSVDQPVKVYIHQLCVGTECSQKDLPGAIDDRDEWCEKENQCDDDDDDDDDDIFMNKECFISEKEHLQLS